MPLWLIILNTGFIIIVAPSCIYVLNKAIKNDKDLAVHKGKYTEHMKTIADAFKQVTQRCRDRAGWIQGLVKTISRMDKNIAVIATKQGLQIERSNPGDTVHGIIMAVNEEEIIDINEKLQ